MPIVPMRDLGKLGVITDLESFDIPMSAHTMGLNVRYTTKGITRGPIYRKVGTHSVTTIRHLITFDDASLTGVVITAHKNGTLYGFAPAADYSAPTVTNLSIGGYTPSTVDLPFTSVFLNDLLYVNREDRVPWYRTRGGTTFTALPVWDSTWRCKSLRSFQGVLVALNVTKAGVNIPTMVKWSDITTFQSYPGTWTPSLSNSAGENTLSDMQDIIVDGYPLRDHMMIYGTNEVWSMDYIGGNNMFSFRRVFKDAGVLNTNCIVDVEGVHYVFGWTDMYKTDGVTKASIADQRVRDFVYGGMQRSQQNQFFVVHHPKLSEIRFCYLSNDGYVSFPKGTDGCNRSAVYNYKNDTWTFEDLPYVSYMSLGAVTSGQPFDSTTTSWDTMGGAYSSLGDPSQRIMLASTVDYGSIPSSLCTHDIPDSTAANAPVLTEANASAYFEKTYIDLDQLQAELRGYKVVTTIYPEAHFSTGASPMTFTLGGCLYANDPITWDVGMTYDGSTNYKLDYKSGGRYLGLKMLFSDYRGFTLSGFDVDLSITGSR